MFLELRFERILFRCIMYLLLNYISAAENEGMNLIQFNEYDWEYCNRIQK